MTGSLEGDRHVLEQLRDAGGDLSKPTEVRYYLYLPGEPAARAGEYDGWAAAVVR